MIHGRQATTPGSPRSEAPGQASRTTQGGGASKVWNGPAKTYYGLPLVKKAHWSWQIVLYFFLGGIAGGSYLISTLADLLKVEKHGVLTRAGRYLSCVCLLASPILLILDPGRPLRFHHMLRVLKFRSVMSLGSWGLTAFGLCNGLTTAYQAASDGLLNWFPALARWMKAIPVKLVEVPGSLLGLFVASYTGVLLSSTAVPVWARARRVLGPLFLTSAISTALASLSCLLAFGRNNQPLMEKLERAEIVSMSIELGLVSALPRQLGSLGKTLIQRSYWQAFYIRYHGRRSCISAPCPHHRQIAQEINAAHPQYRAVVAGPDWRHDPALRLGCCWSALCPRSRSISYL